MITEEILKKQLSNTLEKTDLDFGKGTKYFGKVRDNYLVNGKLVMVTTDRISAFDVVLTTLPFKGQVLNQMSQFWFEKTKNIVKNHMIEAPDPNVTIARNCKPIPIEFIVRGYVTGVTTTSIWYNYQHGVREFCGHKLPDGLKKDQKLNHALVTPTTKAELGQHDETVSQQDIISRGILTAKEFDKIAGIALKLFELGQKIAAKQGIILVDTKYEFGYDDNGEITLIDEVHTPDSSRFWFADTYKELFEKGLEQRKIDKEYVRKWLSDKGFLGKGHVPKIPDDVRVEAARRYIEAYEMVTGERFKAEPGNPLSRIKENLIKTGYLRG